MLRKFSGNAFCKNMSRYLNLFKAKRQSKGVDSVRSRVVNLKEPEKKPEGCRFERQALYARLSGSGIYAADDVCQLLCCHSG